jgi:hypothetical protein
MNDSMRKIFLDSIKTAVQTTANEVAEFLDTVLDEPVKQELIQVLDNVKTKLNQTHVTTQEKKKT